MQRCRKPNSDPGVRPDLSRLGFNSDNPSKRLRGQGQSDRAEPFPSEADLPRMGSPGELEPIGEDLLRVLRKLATPSTERLIEWSRA